MSLRNAKRNPKPSLGLTFFAWLGALIANHFFVFCVAVLGAAFAVGVVTGRTL